MVRRLLIVSDHLAASDALAAHLGRHGFVVVGEVRSARSAALAARRRGMGCRGPPGGPDRARPPPHAGIGATILKHVEGGTLASRLLALGGPA